MFSEEVTQKFSYYFSQYPNASGYKIKAEKCNQMILLFRFFLQLIPWWPLTKVNLNKLILQLLQNYSYFPWLQPMYHWLLNFLHQSPNQLKLFSINAQRDSIFIRYAYLNSKRVTSYFPLRTKSISYSMPETVDSKIKWFSPDF